MVRLHVSRVRLRLRVRLRVRVRVRLRVARCRIPRPPPGMYFESSKSLSWSLNSLSGEIVLLYSSQVAGDVIRFDIIPGDILPGANEPILFGHCIGLFLAGTPWCRVDIVSTLFIGVMGLNVLESTSPACRMLDGLSLGEKMWSRFLSSFMCTFFCWRG